MNMKKLLFLLLLLIPVVAFCGRKKAVKPFPRTRWKEISRMKPDSSVVPFTDTMFLSFNGRDSFSYHIMTGFVYIGPYIFDQDSILDLGTVKYRMLQFKVNKMIVLVNDNGIYKFGVDSSDTVKTIVIPKEEKLLPVTSIDQMIGHWTVYKKTGVGSTGPPDLAMQLRSAYITGPSTEGKLGYLFGGDDPGNAPSWYIKNFNEDQSLQCDGKNPRSFKVIKCQKGEMILEDESMRYFLKQFR